MGAFRRTAQAVTAFKRRTGCGTLMLGLAALAIWPASGMSDTGDAATTDAYLRADYTFVRTVSSNLTTSNAALLGLLAHVRGDCPRAAFGSPQDPESTQLSNELIGDMVLTGGDVDRQAARNYTNRVARMRWSSPSLNREVQSHVRDLRTLLQLQTPDICADVTSWALTGFKALPERTVQFARTFIEGWVRPGNQPPQLRSYEGPSQRALARRAEQVEWRITDFESSAVDTWGEIMDALLLDP